MRPDDGSAFDGEDVVQDALFDAYRRLETYDDSRPIAPWLFRIAHNRCIDFLRRREVRSQAEEAGAEPDVTAPVRQSPYFTRYANLPAPLFARFSDVDGQPALVLYPAGSTPAEPPAFIRISIDDDRIVHVTDYTHCPWVIAGARYVSPIPPGA